MSVLTDRLNSNKYIRFPLTEDADMRDLGDTATLPDDFLVDFQLVSYAASEPGCVLSSVAVNAGGTVVTVTFTVGGSPGAVTVPAAFTDYATARCLSSGTYSTNFRYAATFSEGLQRLAADNHGATFLFDIPLEPSCTIWRNRHRVMSVQAEPLISNTRLTGDILFMEGYNVRVTVLQELNTMRLSALLGEGMGTPCEPMLDPPPVTYGCDEVVYHINGMHPDWMGRFSLLGGQGISVHPDSAGHKLVLKTDVDKCQPGCAKDFEDGEVP